MCVSGIKYDAEKEDKQLPEVRLRVLQRIEDTKQKAAEQGQRSEVTDVVVDRAPQPYAHGQTQRTVPSLSV